MNKFEDAFLRAVDSFDCNEEDYALLKYAADLASRIEPFREQLAELVAIGDKATQGEWGARMLFDFNADDSDFCDAAANLRPLFKEILGEV